MPQMTRIIKITVMIALIAVAFACSKPNSDSVFNADTGHPGDWIAGHGKVFLDSSNTCTECHGQDLRGGISDVSCFSSSFDGTSCHAGGPPGHPLPWSDPDDHGAQAKKAPGPSGGFAFCKRCHGSGFAGGLTGVSCFTCHGVDAPHSPQPWRDGRTHINTHRDNAAVCADCHFNDPINPDPQPGSPGCFNSTLCHGGIHDDGWETDHALTARVDTSTCATANCHGTALTGGLAGVSCYRCHLGGPVPGAGIMHPNRWSDPKASHDGYLENRGKDATSCSPTSSSGVNVAQYCHGTNLLSTSTRIAPPYGSWGVGPSCFSHHGKEWNKP